jgi:DnaJ-class molecular chaperone
VTAKSLYELLGVQDTAEQSELKRAFRSLVAKLHPDLNKDFEEEGKFEVRD